MADGELFSAETGAVREIKRHRLSLIPEFQFPTTAGRRFLFLIGASQAIAKQTTRGGKVLNRQTRILCTAYSLNRFIRCFCWISACMHSYHGGGIPSEKKKRVKELIQRKFAGLLIEQELLLSDICIRSDGPWIAFVC